MRPELTALVEGLRELCPGDPVAVDFETYYDKRCSVRVDGNWAYCRHPDWDAYMVSIYAPDIQYVGPVAGAPWEELVGRVWLAHNRNFDRTVFERLWETGQIQIPGFDTFKPSDPPWSEWHDTADLAVWSHLPRNLAGASALGLGITVSKDARTNAHSKRWPHDFSEEEQQVMLDYALDDSILCWSLWAKFAADWPDHERKLSLHTGDIEFRGVPVDRERIESNIETLQNALWVIKKQIPWLDDKDEKGKPYALGSPRAIARECFRRGVPAPKTTAIKSAEFNNWLDEYGEVVPALMLLSRHRRINRALKVYQNLLKRIRPDGMAALGLKYFGADKTGRWSGTARFNLQNMAKAPIYLDADFNWIDPGPFGEEPAGVEFAVDMRACIVALPGSKLGVVDLSQIEPRVLAWIIRDLVFLGACASGQSPYEAHARASMGWTGGNLKKENPALYALAKARVLALGYGAGWQKFIEMARTYLGSEEAFLEIFAAHTDEDQRFKFLDYNEWLVRELKNKTAKTVLREWPLLDEETRNIWVNSWVQVKDFRTSNPLIANKKESNGTLGIWESLDRAYKSAADTGGTYETGLPSGRSLMYYEVTSARGWSCRQANPQGIPTRMYGGKLTENLVQAVARDVFALGVLRLEEAGFRVFFSVHDEAVFDLPPGRTLEEAVGILAQPPEWAKSLPVAAEGDAMAFYQK